MLRNDLIFAGALETVAAMELNEFRDSDWRFVSHCWRTTLYSSTREICFGERRKAVLYEMILKEKARISKNVHRRSNPYHA